MPAASSASISSAVPIVKRPPRLSQSSSSPMSRRSCDCGSSSSTDTSWPCCSAHLATVEPDSPGPDDQDEHGRGLYLWGSSTGAGSASTSWGAATEGAPSARRGGEDHSAGCLLDHVARHLADVVLGPADAAEQRPAPDPRRLLGSQHDHLDPAPAGLLHDRLPGTAGADRGRGHLHPLVLLPHLLGVLQRAPALLELAFGQRGVQRQRQRHLDHPQRLDDRPRLPLVAGARRRTGVRRSARCRRRGRCPAAAPGSSRTRPPGARATARRPAPSPGAAAACPRSRGRPRTASARPPSRSARPPTPRGAAAPR